LDFVKNSNATTRHALYKEHMNISALHSVDRIHGFMVKLRDSALQMEYRNFGLPAQIQIMGVY